MYIENIYCVTNGIQPALPNNKWKVGRYTPWNDTPPNLSRVYNTMWRCRRENVKGKWDKPTIIGKYRVDEQTKIQEAMERMKLVRRHKQILRYKARIQKLEQLNEKTRQQVGLFRNIGVKRG